MKLTLGSRGASNFTTVSNVFRLAGRAKRYKVVRHNARELKLFTLCSQNHHHHHHHRRRPHHHHQQHN